METATSPKWITAKELAEEFGVSIRTVDQWCADKEIGFFKLGTVRRFDLEEVRRFKERHYSMPRRDPSDGQKEAA